MIRTAARIRIACAVLAVCAALPAFAAAPPPAKDKDKDSGLVDVELPPFFAPLIVETRLQSYAYLTVALTPASPAKVFDIRAKVPFLQDAFLREVNKGTIVKADDSKMVDSVAVKARLTARMNAILPPGTVSDLKLEQIVYAPLLPNADPPPAAP